MNLDIKWYAVESKSEHRSYWRVHGCNGRRERYLLHRVVIDAPENIQVDHINCDSLDNRKENLRLATRSQNLGNRRVRKNSKSGYKGVRVTPGDRFRAYIVRNKKEVNLGTYADALDAAIAYNFAAEKVYGEYARLNQID